MITIIVNRVTVRANTVQCLAQSKPSMNVPCHNNYSWDATPLTVICAPSPKIMNLDRIGVIHLGMPYA